MVKVLHEVYALDGGGVEKPLEALGCTIYKIPRITRDRKGCLKGMKRVISEGNYDQCN